MIELNDKPTEPQEKDSVLHPELGRDKDGLPLLPVVDAEEIAMKDVKRLLAEYVALSWGMCFEQIEHLHHHCFVSDLCHFSCIVTLWDPSSFISHGCFAF